MKALGRCLALLGFAALLQPEYLASPPNSLRLTISTSQHSIRIDNETLKIRAEIYNAGQEDAYIATQLIGLEIAPTRFYFEITGEAGEATDCGLTNSGLGFDVISQWWTRLPPEHYHGLAAEIDSEECAVLKTPGKYRVKAKYISKGGIVPGNEEWKIPPRLAWKGELESNVLTIEVVSQKIKK